MTTAVETIPNSRDRKTLASQLDRLDDILTGLAGALNESVATAVQQAVGDVLTTILTDPTFTDRLRGPGTPPVAENVSTDTTTPPPPPGPGLLGKVTGALRAGCGHVQRACGEVVRRATTLAGSGRSFLSSFFSGRLLPLAGVIVTAGLVAYLVGPHLPLLLTGAAGWLATLIARARSSLRRSPIERVSTVQ
jgi:GMP synthase PP-ATPase subunit